MKALHEYCQETFGGRLVKLAVNAGFTCPNRDGTKATGGCTFCSAAGSGDFAGTGEPSGEPATLRQQLLAQKEMLARKWKKPPARYAAYFQSFTTTHGPSGRWLLRLREALDTGLVDGLVIATRPDCVDDGVVRILSTLPIFWVELGLQTASDTVHARLNCHYNFADHARAVSLLQAAGIPCVTHLICGLPGDDFLVSVRAVAAMDPPPWGIKLAALNILRGTQLAADYTTAPWPLPTLDEYAALVREALTLLPPDTVIHRLTGDGDHTRLIAPQWIKQKRAVLAAIHKKT